MAGTLAGVCITCAGGNEAGRGCHYLGRLEDAMEYTEVELRVGAVGEKGFVTELWARAPDIYSVGFVSPAGETVARLEPAMGRLQRYLFFWNRPGLL